MSEPELVLQTITDPTESNTYQSGGVAVSNVADINYGDIKNKPFKDNRVSGKLVNNTGGLKPYLITGGTVYNAGVIGDVEADFIGNLAGGNQYRKSVFTCKC